MGARKEAGSASFTASSSTMGVGHTRLETFFPRAIQPAERLSSLPSRPQPRRNAVAMMHISNIRMKMEDGTTRSSQELTGLKPTFRIKTWRAQDDLHLSGRKAPLPPC